MTQSLLKLVKEAFVCYENKTAIIENRGFGTSCITYQELRQASETIAQTIAQISKGNNRLFGVCLEQSLAYPAVITGILHFGSAFACVDPSWSLDEKISFLRNLDISWFITNSQDLNAGKVSKQNSTLLVKGDSSSRAEINIAGSDLNLKFGTVVHQIPILGQELQIIFLPSNSVCSLPADIVYVVRTSGSTGKPKVVRVPENAVVPNILDIKTICTISSDDIVFLSSPSTFDPSVVELFIALSSGASLLVTPHAVKASPSLLLKVLFPPSSLEGVTVLQITPSVFCRWTKEELQNIVLAEKSPLRSLILGGEPCPPLSVISSWRGEGNQTSFFNIYGITEVSIWASINPLKMADIPDAIELGKPLSETILEVRDVHTGSVIETGVGEMFIGSSSRICVIDEEKHSDLTPPVYRATGDIVRKDGMCFYYIGRRDHVVKRWGQRVNLESIELLAATHKSVERACCVVSGEKNLLHLFVVPVKPKHENLEDTLRQFLIEHVSGTAGVPDEVCFVDHFPLTLNGMISNVVCKGPLMYYVTLKECQFKILNVVTDSRKNFELLHDEDMTEVEEDLKQLECKVDRTALCSNLSSHTAANTPSEPVLNLEKELHRIWCSILGVQCTAKSFLSLGGNSILALTMANKIKEITGEVSDDFISVLLSGGNFKDCMNVLASFMTEKKKLNDNGTVKHFEFSFVIKHNKSKTTNNESAQKSNTIESFSSVVREKFSESEGELEEPMTKKLKVLDDLNTSLVSSSSRGCFMEFIRGSRVQRIPICEVKKPLDMSLKKKWSTNLQKCIDASPLCLTFESGLVCVAVGSHSGLFAVCDGKAGDVMSSCTLPDRIESSACHSRCGKYLYVGCYDGHLYCIAVNSGGIKWKFQTGGVIKGSLTLSEEGDKVLVGSYDHELYCIDAENGEIVWQFSIETLEYRGSWTGSPVFVHNFVIAAQLAGIVVALRIDNGNLVWKHKLTSPVFTSLAKIMFETPLVLCSEMNEILHCYEALTGVEIWQWKTGGKIFSSPSVLHEEGEKSALILFGSNDGYIYCISASSNNMVHLQWKTALGNPITITTTPFPFLINFNYEHQLHKSDRTSDGGLSYAEGNMLLNEDRVTNCLPYCIATCSTGVVFLIDVKTGSVKAQCSLPAEVYSSPALCGTSIFVGCRDDYLYSLELQ